MKTRSNVVGEFINTPIEKELNMINLHVCFFTEFTKYILNDMVIRNEGHILNIASTGSYIPTPHDAVYSATKAYMLSFSKALYAELKNSNVSVTTICPGSTNTEFAKKAKLDNSVLFKLFVMHPGYVAKIGYKSMLNGKDEVIVGLYNKLLVLFSKIMPKFILQPLTIWMLKKR